MQKVKPSRTQCVCQACGHIEPKWMGRCPECSEWNSFVEETVGKRSPSTASPPGQPVAAAPLTKLTACEAQRISTGITELDRVLGGGIVPGSLVLLGGDPGTGKSTLLLQALAGVGAANASQANPVLYVTGEESAHQTALRAERLGTRNDALWVLAETDLERIIEQAERMRPTVLAIDSIQTVGSSLLEAIPGTVTQVRHAASRFMDLAKRQGIPTLLVGHVTKDGSLAGPKTLEHMVDAVLSFEGGNGHPYRMLRATKNRFGPTHEVGVFEMRDVGLVEVASPSEVFLAERPVGRPGSVVVASLEGTRPILVEVQALVATPSGSPRRVAIGVDTNRVSLLMAVLDRRAGIDVLGQDVFVNVAGGMRVSEPAMDLGILLALASSAKGRPIDAKSVVFGEVGLAGEVRSVRFTEQRMSEAERLGFSRCIMPERDRSQLRGRPTMPVVGVRDVHGALEVLFDSFGADDFAASASGNNRPPSSVKRQERAGLKGARGGGEYGEPTEAVEELFGTNA